MLKGFTAADAESKQQRINDINTKIDILKGQLREVSGKFDDYSTSLIPSVLLIASSI